MSRKTALHGPAAARFRPPVNRMFPSDVPRLEKPLLLECGVCGASGRYHVGSVVLNPRVVASADEHRIENATGFTAYFRCRKCDAGGPWKLPDLTLMRIMGLSVAAMAGEEGVPLILGASATFDGYVTRYPTEAEDHLKELIARDPERALLWVRLGNLYSHAELHDRAEAAYLRAIELDPKDIDAHGMFGQLLRDTGRPIEAVPHWHAVLKHVRDAHQVPLELRKQLVRGAVDWLLEAHFESDGKIDFIPKTTPEELAARNNGEPPVLEIREFDLGSEKGIQELCDSFLGLPPRRFSRLFGRKQSPAPVSPERSLALPQRRTDPPPGRNALCPCGSGHKYKKCCGRSLNDRFAG